MIKYKNISYSAKTFYGVKFEPGEIKEVPGYVNCIGMVRINDSKHTTNTPKAYLFEGAAPTSTRGRKKKSNEPEKVLFAETEQKIEISKEETSDGN